MLKNVWMYYTFFLEYLVKVPVVGSCLVLDLGQGPADGQTAQLH